MNDQPIPVHGVTTRHVLIDGLDARIEELDRLGFTVVDAGLTGLETKKLSASLDAIYANQLAETGEALAAAANDLDVVRAPLAYDADFVGVATNSVLNEICGRLFGQSFVLLQQNGLINRPAPPQYQSRWHRDLSYQHFTISRKIAINALLCLDPFTEVNGATHVLPGSHLFADFPSDEFVRLHEHVISAGPGSLLMMDAMLYHRAGENRSSGVRRGVNHVIGLPLLAQQIDLPRLLGGKYADDEFLSRYLGYRWNPASDPATWRAIRGSMRR